jgi:hypothetical protein
MVILVVLFDHFCYLIVYILGKTDITSADSNT